VHRTLAPFPASRSLSRQDVAQVDPLPVLLLRHGPVPMRSLTALHEERRLELFVADQLTSDWISFAQRVAGTCVATDGDPLSALVYALTAGIKAPIIMLIARRYKSECKELVAAGASECIAMPIGAKDQERIIHLLASHASLSRIDTTLRLLLDPIARTVRYHDKIVHLSQREFAVLQCLSSFGGRPVAAHKLVTYVWGERASVERPRQILDVYIFQLRRKLERIGLGGAISTVRGLGYALVQVTSERHEVS
jgi:DNA-binding response OmpR family regulator